MTSGMRNCGEYKEILTRCVFRARVANEEIQDSVDQFVSPSPQSRAANIYGNIAVVFGMSNLLLGALSVAQGYRESSCAVMLSPRCNSTCFESIVYTSGIFMTGVAAVLMGCAVKQQDGFGTTFSLPGSMELSFEMRRKTNYNSEQNL